MWSNFWVLTCVNLPWRNYGARRGTASGHCWSDCGTTAGKKIDSKFFQVFLIFNFNSSDYIGKRCKFGRRRLAVTNWRRNWIISPSYFQSSALWQEKTPLRPGPLKSFGVHGSGQFALFWIEFILYKIILLGALFPRWAHHVDHWLHYDSLTYSHCSTSQRRGCRQDFGHYEFLQG